MIISKTSAWLSDFYSSSQKVKFWQIWVDFLVTTRNKMERQAYTWYTYCGRKCLIPIVAAKGMCSNLMTVNINLCAFFFCCHRRYQTFATTVVIPSITLSSDSVAYCWTKINSKLSNFKNERMSGLFPVYFYLFFVVKFDYL